VQFLNADERQLHREIRAPYASPGLALLLGAAASCSSRRLAAGKRRVNAFRRWEADMNDKGWPIDAAYGERCPPMSAAERAKLEAEAAVLIAKIKRLLKRYPTRVGGGWGGADSGEVVARAGRGHGAGRIGRQSRVSYTDSCFRWACSSLVGALSLWHCRFLAVPLVLRW